MDDESEEDFDDQRDTDREAIPLSKAALWKPAKYVSFETIALTSTKLKPAGLMLGFNLVLVKAMVSNETNLAGFHAAAFDKGAPSGSSSKSSSSSYSYIYFFLFS